MLAIAVAAAAVDSPSAQMRAPDCFDAAAATHGVNSSVLRGMAVVESKGNPSAVNRNANGSIDGVLLQINSVHFPDRG